MIQKFTRWFNNKFSISYLDCVQFELKEAKTQRMRCMSAMLRCKHDINFYDELIAEFEKDIVKDMPSDVK